MAENKKKSYIKIFRENMESTVKPTLNDCDVYEGLMDLFHLVVMEAYEKGYAGGYADGMKIKKE